MAHSDLSPISVVNYSRDFLIDLVRYKTGWDQRNEVSDKIQLTYLCSYLEVNHIAAKTIVVENEYIDRHYLEDYAEYYARCFASHSKKCTRVHFFSMVFEENDFIDALEINKTEFIDQLSESYIGFAVIRPIPHTFLAKVCVKPYAELLSNQEYKLITKEHCVSLFGLPLTVETAAFLEQDKVVSACATSALWMLYSSSFQKPLEHLPSPSAITKSASLPGYEEERTFPTNGLSPLQVARSLKHFQLEPILLSCRSENNFFDLKEAAYAYISNNIPVIIGGEVYQQTTPGTAKHIGRHLVCALGIHKQNITNTKISYILNSHSVDKIYVHDDRYGPYVKFDANPIVFIDENDNSNKKGLGFYLKKNDVIERTEYFVPDIIIVGLYHKVRVPYLNIRNTCTAIYVYLKRIRSALMAIIRQGIKDKDEEAYCAGLITNLKKPLAGVWDISLTTNTKIKNELLSENNFESFNGGTSKENLLLQNMPRYIWRCRVLSSSTNKPEKFTDILFDATEVPQGRVLIGYISYSNDAESVWKYIEQNSFNRVWMTYDLTDEVKENLSSLWKFFSKSKNKTYLNTLYGPLGLPRRQLKNGEEDKYHNIKIRNDVLVIRPGSSNNWSPGKDKKYIWVINDIGDLAIGEDIVETNDLAKSDEIIDYQEFQGHPTLVDGKPARLGGELIWAETKNNWVINLRSRTYSAHIKAGSAKETTFLDNVIKNNFAWLNPEGVSKDFQIN